MAESTPNQSVFIQGSIPLHVMRMSITGSIGLIGIFLVDFLDMYFLSLLGHAELAAAVGFAGSVTFFMTYACVGLSIATGILLSRLIGQQNFDEAKAQLNGAMIFTFLITVTMVVCFYPFIDDVLFFLGARGLTAVYAEDYLRIVLLTLPFLGLALCFSAALRSLGAASAAMTTTLMGSLVNGILDPIFIFGLDLSVKGAAIASALASITMFLTAFFFLSRRYNFFVKIDVHCILPSFKCLLPLAVPAILTNFATPFANAYLVAKMSDYGDEAVSGFSIIGRIIPVAFAIIFALSGAVGPIVGQNLGAKQIDRIHQTLKFSYIFVVVYVIACWIVLDAISDWIGGIFNATGESAALINLFCDYLCLAHIFVGINFVANAFFNNMGKPSYSTIINWLKATIGTVPFVYVGGLYYGDDGLLWGQSIGNIVFGIIAFVWVKLYLRYCHQLQVR
ncbi:MAG: MATE family efflux transporter [Cellvibrionales bacterium]|nr:MATE family efflux transporter [Cellvibrionales bacterium]